MSNGGLSPFCLFFNLLLSPFCAGEPIGAICAQSPEKGDACDDCAHSHIFAECDRIRSSDGGEFVWSQVCIAPLK
jgi:hypothetical protein